MTWPNTPSSYDEAISYLTKLIIAKDENFGFVTEELIRYQLETAHTDNDFAALKSYYDQPGDVRHQMRTIGMEESWLDGLAELVKKSLKSWKQNMVPGRAVFFRCSYDPFTKSPKYVYLYVFKARHTHDAAIAKLARMFGDVGETPDEQLRAAGIFHYRIVYMYAYKQPQVAMMFSTESVIRQRVSILLPEQFKLPEMDAFKVLPLREVHPHLEVKDGVFGPVIIGERYGS